MLQTLKGETYQSFKKESTMDDDTDIAVILIWIVLVPMALWIWEPWEKWIGEFSTYHAVCINGKDISCLKYEDDDEVVYKINEDLNQVTIWIEDAEEIPPVNSTNCAIRDYQNWQCSNGPLGNLVMSKGVILSKRIDHFMTPTVKKWQWYLLKAGLSFEQGFWFGKKADLDWLNDIQAFPSVWMEYENDAKLLKKYTIVQ